MTKPSDEGRQAEQLAERLREALTRPLTQAELDAAAERLSKRQGEKSSLDGKAFVYFPRRHG